jgi:DNA-binding LacI/PurR family transcriptional regulator
VPGDISVIGFDDLDIATIIEPSLTTIAQPAYDIGTTAMDTLIRLIDGHKNAMPIVLDTRLVVRRSVR